MKNQFGIVLLLGFLFFAFTTGWVIGKHKDAIEELGKRVYQLEQAGKK